MVEILGKPKVEANDWFDLLEIGIAKSVEEKFLAGTFVGNGTVKSGIIKAVGAGVVHGIGGGNKHIKAVSSALAIDAVEDVVVGLIMPMIGGALPGSAAEQAANPYGL